MRSRETNNNNKKKREERGCVLLPTTTTKETRVHFSFPLSLSLSLSLSPSLPALILLGNINRLLLMGWNLQQQQSRQICSANSPIASTGSSDWHWSHAFYIFHLFFFLLLPNLPSIYLTALCTMNTPTTNYVAIAIVVCRGTKNSERNNQLQMYRSL